MGGDQKRGRTAKSKPAPLKPQGMRHASCVNATRLQLLRVYRRRGRRRVEGRSDSAWLAKRKQSAARAALRRGGCEALTRQLTARRALGRLVCSTRWGFAGRCEAATMSAPALAEFFTLLRRHLFPPLVHALFYSTAASGMMRAANAVAPDQNPTEGQQSESLPEGNLANSKQRRHEPVPEMHDQFAADPNEQRNRRRADKNKR